MNRNIVIGVSVVFLACLVIPAYVQCAEDRFVVLNEDQEEVFNVDEKGGVAVSGVLLTNGAGTWGSAPFVLGQNALNRGIVITDKAASNQKNIYFGWNVGATHEYAEIFALQEGVAYKNLILNPSGDGYVGIRTTSPSHPLQMGSGAYVSTGGVWTNASSREYKKDIKRLSTQKAIDTLKQLDPVEFVYKADKEEKHVGFIAEDAPELVASKDKKGMSSMDVVAVLTKVVQEQQKTISELSKEMVQLRKELRSKGTPTLAKVRVGD